MKAYQLAFFSICTLALNSCGESEMDLKDTNQNSNAIVEQAMNNAVSQPLPTALSDPNLVSAYDDIFQRYCAGQLPEAQAIYNTVSQGFINGPYCWLVIMNAITTYPGSCYVPIRDHWTSETYAAFFYFLLTEYEPCYTDISNP